MEDISKYIFKSNYSALPKDMGGGPQNLGDPDSRKLRKLEETVLIPEMKREIIRTENCKEVWANFGKCSKIERTKAPWACKNELNLVKDCHKKWYNDEEFTKEVTELYLNRRSHYRRTGEGFSVRIKNK